MALRSQTWNKCRRTMLIGASLLGSMLVCESSASALDVQSYATFADLRGRLLAEISSAKRSVRIASPYLTDGDIVTALFLAQYRKIDVQVLLGREKSGHYLSRLNYLKSQNIPVFLKPADFKPRDTSALMADNKLLLIDGDLDSLKKSRRTTVTEADPEEARAFQETFTNAVSQAIPAVARATPLVGKAKNTPPKPGGWQSPPTSAATAPVAAAFKPRPATVPAVSTDAFNYDRSRSSGHSAPEGIAKKLPRETIVQKRLRQQLDPPGTNGGSAKAPDSATVEEPK